MAEEHSTPTTRVGAREAFKRQIWSSFVVWKYGGGWERVLLSAWIATLGFLVVWISQLARLAWDPSGSPWPLEVVESYVLAVLMLGAYALATVEPLHNARIIREFLALGWFQGLDAEYAREMVRYLETHGRNGRIPGGTWWAITNWVAYYATVGLSVPFASATRSSLGQWTPFVFLALCLPVALGFVVASTLRARRLFADARARGFRLADLEAERVDRLRGNLAR